MRTRIWRDRGGGRGLNGYTRTRNEEVVTLPEVSDGLAVSWSYQVICRQKTWPLRLAFRERRRNEDGKLEERRNSSAVLTPSVPPDIGVHVYEDSVRCPLYQMICHFLPRPDVHIE